MRHAKDTQAYSYTGLLVSSSATQKIRSDH